MPKAAEKLAKFDNELLYSTRNRKGKFLQRLILDISRVLVQGLSGSVHDTHASICVRYSNTTCSVILSTTNGIAASCALSTALKRDMTMLCDALLRQIFRLTGAEGFELATWDNRVLTQPAELSLLSPGGLQARLFNPTVSANRTYHGIIKLSDDMDVALGCAHRTTKDLDAFFARFRSQGWSTMPHTPQASRFGTPNNPATGASYQKLASGGASADAIRASSTKADTPCVLHLIDAYEASLVRATTHRTSVWGQDDSLAVERTEKRAAKLNDDLTSDLKPLSRSLKTTSVEELIALANNRPLTHLGIEFGVSDKAIAKRLAKAGWVSPRGWRTRKSG